ncbi:hypothetical protein EJ02DRAFT_356414 [Clathrospora elynae]|uniref:SH3 domain-containing protein n=1 Tax=Clathrospora elynae TaxID=706981 RepID=A0A6A5SCG0_9PLEO|nr:hypothetical protein EJ02DRAFT_356414 [Clathrospora elynae]
MSLGGVSSEGINLASALSRLDNLDSDQYIIALDPNGRQFYATPNGYHSTYIPAQILEELSAGHVGKIVWASFGSEPDSWFFACELRDGTPTFQTGHGIPLALRQFIQQLGSSGLLLTSLRVQLGANQSFVVWSRTLWACSGVPQMLRAKLCEGSSSSREWADVTKGSLKTGTLDNVQWSSSGSFFLKSGDKHIWDYHAKLVHTAWGKLWQVQGRDELRRMYVMLDPHAQSGTTFVFLKKHRAGEEEAPFIFRFENGAIHSNLAIETEPTYQNQSDPQPDGRLQHGAQKTEHEMPLQWATCKKAGKPHPRDSWELEVKEGERVKVLQDMGRNWYVVLNGEDINGWIHRSWLVFDNREPMTKPKDAKDAYTQFEQDVQKLLVPGQLREFPTMTDYMDACTKRYCQLLKEDVSSLGICAHDLLLLLEGSDNFSYGWIKEGRNMWHPDRFARFCHAEHAERLKPMAGQMFVLYGILMEACKP